jgi:hypothetical protein
VAVSEVILEIFTNGDVVMEEFSFGFDYENDTYSNPRNKYAPMNLFDEQEDDEDEEE